jgi:hypothetical protein
VKKKAKLVLKIGRLKIDLLYMLAVKHEAYKQGWNGG